MMTEGKSEELSVKVFQVDGPAAAKLFLVKLLDVITTL